MEKGGVTLSLPYCLCASLCLAVELVLLRELLTHTKTLVVLLHSNHHDNNNTIEKFAGEKKQEQNSPCVYLS